jgi:hypothetical protein
MSDPERYWFRAKRYGWGWGLPLTWQGWLVLIAFFAAMAGSALLFLPGRTDSFLACMTVLTLILVAVCYAKGEPPRWRWG